MDIPIILTAFGTTSKAAATYQYIDTAVKSHYCSHEIHWAYSSRLVRHLRRKKGRVDVNHTHEVLAALRQKGHQWAVVQSLHLFCGHEFYRMIGETDVPDIRSSIGLPLLCSLRDHIDVIRAMSPVVGDDPEEAVILVSHGTDHPAWTANTAFHHLLQERHDKRVFSGVVEGGYPGLPDILPEIGRKGFKKVRLVPFMLVAGVHFEEDIMGTGDSWRTAFESEGITVSYEPTGLGMNPGVMEVFFRHIESALDVIPSSTPVCSDAYAERHLKTL